jgi:hypothetical protein
MAVVERAYVPTYCGTMVAVVADADSVIEVLT